MSTFERYLTLWVALCIFAGRADGSSVMHSVAKIVADEIRKLADRVAGSAKETRW